MMNVVSEARQRQGTMCRNLVIFLDHVDTHCWLGLRSSDEPVGTAARRAQTASLLRNPVFIGAEKYNGPPNMTRHPLLRAELLSRFGEDANAFPAALFVPLGDNLRRRCTSLPTTNSSTAAEFSTDWRIRPARMPSERSISTAERAATICLQIPVPASLMARVRTCGKEWPRSHEPAFSRKLGRHGLWPDPRRTRYSGGAVQRSPPAQKTPPARAFWGISGHKSAVRPKSWETPLQGNDC